MLEANSGTEVWHVLTRSALKGFFFSTCLYQKENNLFLASQPLQRTRSSGCFRFSCHSISKRNPLYQATWRNEIKTVCSKLLSVKHMKQLGGEVCTEYTHTAEYERFLEVKERTLFRTAAQAPVKQSTMMWCPSLRWGAAIYQLGAKQVNLESNNFFKSYQWLGHTGQGKI